jgi:hypothetical protein
VGQKNPRAACEEHYAVGGLLYKKFSADITSLIRGTGWEGLVREWGTGGQLAIKYSR